MIGYYVHHHGSGHLARAAAIARRCAEPVVALSSVPRPAGPSTFADWVALPADPRMADPDDPTAGGALHWSPTNSPGYRDRMASIAQWMRAARPRLVVVDVSVEVCVLVRALGTPVVAVTLPGERDDAAHQLAYGLAALILAPWPRALYRPAFLDRVGAKVAYLGAMSRFDDRTPSSAPKAGSVQVLAGSGGGGASPATLRALHEHTGGRCGGLGGPFGWHADVWHELCAAEVVVTHAGLNALAEVAAARRPAIVVPEARPYREQHTTARALADAGLAVVLDAWPAPERWPALLAEARERDGAGWTRWNDTRAAERAADRLARVPG